MAFDFFEGNTVLGFAIVEAPNDPTGPRLRLSGSWQFIPDPPDPDLDDDGVDDVVDADGGAGTSRRVRSSTARQRVR